MLMRACIILCALLMCGNAIAADNATAVVTSQGFVKVHKGPSPSATVIAFARAGDKYKVLWESNEWVKIKYEKVEGWVQKKNVRVESGGQTPAPVTAQPPALGPGPSSQAAGSSPASSAPPVKPVPRQPGGTTTTPPAQFYPGDQPAPAMPEPEKVVPRRRAREIQTSWPVPKSKQRRREDDDAAQRLAKASADKQKQKTPRYTTYVRVITELLNVFSSPDEFSLIIGVVQQGERYPLVDTTDTWFQIVFGDTTGWIIQRNSEIVDRREPVETSRRIPLLPLFFIAVAGAGLAAGSFVFLRRQGGVRRRKAQKSVLLIAVKKKMILDTVTNSPVSLESCFREIDFSIDRVRDIPTALNNITHHPPDIVLADWGLSRTLAGDIERLLSSRASMASVPFIIYDCPDPRARQASSRTGGIHYLGSSFSVGDLFRLVRPLAVNGQAERIVRRSVVSTALEGNISEEGLSGVLELIEMGNKAGYLSVDDGSTRGTAYFENGMVIFAESRNRTGRKAVEEILNMKKGQFQFHAGVKAERTNCQIPIMGILMEWAQSQDETRRKPGT